MDLSTCIKLWHFNKITTKVNPVIVLIALLTLYLNRVEHVAVHPFKTFQESMMQENPV